MKAFPALYSRLCLVCTLAFPITYVGAQPGTGVAPKSSQSKIASSPTSPAIPISSQGMRKLRAGNIDAAIANFDAAIEADPEYVLAYNNRALAYHLKGDFERALADYDLSIKHAIDNATYARLYRCVVQRQLKRGEPEAELKAATEKWGATWPKTIALYLSGQTSEADFLQELIRPSPKAAGSAGAEGPYFIAMSALLKGDVERAREMFQKSIAAGPANRPAVMLARAELKRLPPKP